MDFSWYPSLQKNCFCVKKDCKYTLCFKIFLLNTVNASHYLDRYFNVPFL